MSFLFFVNQNTENDFGGPKIYFGEYNKDRADISKWTLLGKVFESSYMMGILVHFFGNLMWHTVKISKFFQTFWGWVMSFFRRLLFCALKWMLFSLEVSFFVTLRTWSVHQYFLRVSLLGFCADVCFFSVRIFLLR